MQDITDRFSIGIIGMGMVGKAAKEHYKNAKVYDVDLKLKTDSLKEVLGQEWIFVCAPTPSLEDGSIDLSAIEDIISKIPDGKKIILKSTVIPGTTEKLQEKYPNKLIVFSPEFMAAKQAVEDFAHPDKNVVGFTKQYPDLAKEVIRILPAADNNLICTATQAEIIKYTLNSFFAIKVVFANEIYDLCQALDINYDIVRQGMAMDKKVQKSLLNVPHEGRRGFGGACLPKDTRAILKQAQTLGVDLTLLKQAVEVNKRLRKIN